MKDIPPLDGNQVNIYDSEMSAETIESYEKYYKNQNECNTVCDNEKRKDCDNTNKVPESNGHDLSNDETRNVTDTRKHDSNNDSERKRRVVEGASKALPCKKRKKEYEPPKLREDNRDIFCWRCHKYVVETDVIPCYFCPRVYHLKCVHIQEKPSGFWLCTECDAVNAAENPDKISPALSKLQKKDLAALLTFVLKRMRQHEGSSHYENPVDLESYPDYKDYIIKPMYLTLLENNIKNLKYSSCESFLADTKWMVHNSYVFNTVHSELTLYAKAMMKNAKHECDEIINCPDCYLHANTLEEDRWFIEPCDKPHVLVWARLKGFPYWPCKVMKANGTNVDVRFFGDHNKSLVPVDCCYLYSKQMPSKQKKVEELEIAIKEASQHIKRLQERFHVFQYAPLKTMYNPKEEDEQRKLLLPYYDKPFFIKVKDREKLFDPKVINNIFDDPSPMHKTDPKEESKTDSMSESPNALEMKNKKIILKPSNEELSPYKFSPSSINLKPTPCNKPTIIIEDTDNISSSNILNHSRQPSIISCEKLSSPCIFNKALSTENENPVIGSPTLSMNEEHDSSVLERTEDLNCTLNNNHFKSKINVTNNTTKEQDNAKDNDRINLLKKNNIPSENSKSDVKQLCFISEQVNCLPLTIPTLDKYNNHFSDKLRINSNAKLINVVTDNPDLINNYIFKPMVVIQKLKDEVFRDYSNNISWKTKITTPDKPKKSEENHSSKLSSSDNGKKETFNFDLLNGNLSDLVSVTEIDLDKDESLSINNNNTEAENIKCNGPGINKGSESISSPSSPIIKSERIDDDELEDTEYIKRLSKSILESTLDYNNVNCVEENKISSSSNIINESCEKILVVDRDYHSLKKDNPVIENKDCHKQSSSNRIMDLEIVEDDVELNSQKSSRASQSIVSNAFSVVSPILPETDINHKVIYISDKEDEDNIKDKAHQISLNINVPEIKINEVSKTVNTNVVENNKHGPENSEVSYSDENSNEKHQSGVIENIDDMLGKEQNVFESRDDVCQQRDLGNKSCCNISPATNDDSRVLNSPHSAEENEVIKEKDVINLNGSPDCEIVKISFPPKNKIPKPIGFKRMKKFGGVIKRVIKNGMLSTSPTNQNVNLTSKEKCVDAENLSSKTRFSGDLVKNHSTSNYRPTSNEGSAILKSALEKCADNMVSATVRVREENKIMSLEIETILNKVEKIEAKGKLMQVLREELEKFEDHCKKKIESYKHAYIEEMDSLYNMEKQRWIQETMSVSENESRMMVDEIKKKQWCILCLNEAKFHCCWSTSYCSEKCQLADWPVHMKTCTQYSMRIGDPNLRLSPELRKVFKGEHDILNQRIQDLLESDRFNSNNTNLSPYSPSCSSSSVTNPFEVTVNNSTNSLITSPKSSTILVQKNVPKQDMPQGLENPGNPVVKIVPTPAVYLSGMAANPNQSKTVIHVPKQNPTKPNVLLQNPSHSLHVPYS